MRCNVRIMSNATQDVKPDPPMMTRVDITPEEWAQVRILSIRAGVTTQKWIGDVLREKIAS